MNEQQHETLNEQLNDDLLAIFMDLVNGRARTVDAMDRVNNRVEAAYNLGVATQAAELSRLQQAAREVVEIIRDEMLVQRLTKTKAGSEAWRTLAAALAALEQETK